MGIYLEVNDRTQGFQFMRFFLTYLQFTLAGAGLISIGELICLFLRMEDYLEKIKNAHEK
ncbi:MAG: hypothetical protein HXY40_13610 [Chloroflexi bacterium]|nr:hypothetical protein [Chloroflexota bacterium]